MKKLVLGLLLLSGFIAKAQVYNNEWIDYSQTYYKFKVGKTGLYRISQAVLSSAGLVGTPAEYFQLWRNGKQVPIYTSVASGALSGGDYIEFWGEMNDGKPDRELYRDPSWQLNDKWSLETDTATYFLTVNTNVSGNLRLQATANNVAGTSLPVEPYFMYTAGKYFKDRINSGYAVNVGEYMYSSSYDKGEGWSSNDIVSSFDTACVATYGKNLFVFKNLNVYKLGQAPAPEFKIAVSGNLVNQRRYLAKINSDSVIGNPVDFFNYMVDSASFSISTLNSTSDTVTVFNLTNPTFGGCPPVDRMVVHQYEITYPRTFNFNNQKSFEFILPANPSGNYLQITNFSYGSSTPVLYDLTNGKRYAADRSSAPMLKFVLEPSLVDRNLVLVSEEAGNINTIASLETRNFINYTDASNQGDYLIISNPILFAGAGGSNPVEEYKSYRSSAAGGAYDAKIYLADEIVDQFGFGIKKNPAAIRDFLRYAREQFTVSPKHVFIIGHGVNYMHQRTYEATADISKLNLVPTYGYPASDILLTANRGSSLPQMSIGRLSVVTPEEVSVYLKKIKDFELAQTVQSPLIKDKAWMKNVVHIIGASDENLDNILSEDMKNYAAIISDTLFGGKVITFNKATSDAVSQVSRSALSNLFSEGISIITYFGHSSSTTLEFNLDDPQNYQNFGKYPLFIGMGCNAGDFFRYSTTRFITKETISEKYVLAPDRGTIGFIASTHFGIVHYLNIWAERAYANISYKDYGNAMGDIIKTTAADVFNYTTEEDFYARCNTEQTEFHGDPALRLNPHTKPDYVIEDSLVKMPGLASIADQSFKVDVSFLNMGKAPDSTIVLEVKRQLPDQSVVVVRRDTIQGIPYSRSMVVDVPVSPSDKGLNKIIVTVDADNNVDELFENNNSVTKDVMVYENELRPIYPYNYAIVNHQDIKLSASTANPFDTSKQYFMELDTTALFNSPFKISRTVVSKGGIVEFDPGVDFTDHTVYYWRTSPPPNNNEYKWNTSSFIYIANSQSGFNQSHFYQHTKSTAQNITIDSTSRKWEFGKVTNNLFMRNGVFPTAASFAVDFSVAVNGDPYIRSVCGVSNIIVNVIDPLTFKPWINAHAGSPSQYGSDPVCGESRLYNFQYNILDTNKRRKLMELLDLIPDNYYVVVKNTSGTAPNSNTYASDWKKDTTYLGAGNSIYNRLYNQGFTSIDSFNKPRAWIFVYQKNNQQDFTPQSVFSDGIYDKITLSVDCKTPDSTGNIVSPVFGPARAWKELKWNGATEDASAGDEPIIKLLGINANGTIDTLRNNIDLSQQTVDISSVDARRYPYLQLYMQNTDSVYFTPYQLSSWQLTADPAPEGAMHPTQHFKITDTVEVAQPLEFEMAFKNVSEFPFTDSMKVKAIITDRNNTAHVIPAWKQRVLAASPDSLHIRYTIDTKQFSGNNSLYVEVNPDNDQPEQYHFNNFFYKDFYVRGDTINPLLDVTFDNVHILNHDIVSARPNILIKLRDEAKWFLLDDPSKIKVQLRKFSKGTDPGYLRDYKFDADTLQFVAANQAPPANNNSVSAIFKPMLEDGEYELIVNGMDMSENSAGTMEYRVAFEVINKPMISNMLNYPNPFTTSTAFVFTITGSEVPQNIRIQILTVTGKIVREITKDELGPLHIGRNITEFKWDGTDQYGQKLANGVYLYRVITNLNGKSLDKYTSSEDNTDKYFNKGYGKMYLMR